MKVKTIILAALAMLTLVSCDKMFVSDRTGKVIMFSASSDLTSATKTEYSGEVIDGRERINWLDGDPVKILMYTHENGPSEVFSKDYHVVEINTEGVKSTGKVASQNGALVWQEGMVHDFYSIYPANYIGTEDVANRTIHLTLPSAQFGDLDANMRYAYMAAIAEGYTTEGKGSVVLDYYPMVTTLYITLHNGTSEPINVKSVRVKTSDSNHPLVGTYKITSTGGTNPFIPVSGNFNNNISATSPEVSIVLENANLEPGASKTCVIFLMPVTTYDPSTMTLTLVTDGGIADLNMANSGNIQFQPCKKYNLSFNIEERPVTISDLTPVMNNLCLFSDSILCADFEYLDWMTPKGLYYKGNEWPRRPVPDDVLAEALLQVTEISSEFFGGATDKLVDLTPADFTIFPNLTSINLTGLGNNKSFSVANLSNLLGLVYSGNAAHLSIANCNFDPDDSTPLVIDSSNKIETMSLTNITGLKEIILQAGMAGGGNIGEVFIQNCPDLRTIKILAVNGGHIALEKAVFDNLAVETIYIQQANFTADIEIKNCYNLERFILWDQNNWLLKRVSVSNCPVLGDSAPDDSEYGLTGFNIECINDEVFNAYKYNCPNLGPTFQTRNKYGPITVTFE